MYVLSLDFLWVQILIDFLFPSSQLRRIKSTTNTHRELPPINMGHSVDEFFKDIEKSSDEGKLLPNW
jgi:hypothetical protein